MRRAALVAVACALACHGSAGPSTLDAGDDGGAATPVHVANVQRTTLLEIVSAPGRTASTEQQQVRAPFAGELLRMDVADGDRVATGQVLGTLLATTSVAALEGARVMRESAHSARQRRDAERALQLAERGRVKHVLRAPEAGIVVSHNADEGALVPADQVIVTIAALDSFVFLADVVQNDLRRVRPGQPATIDLTAERRSFHAVVHSLLPSASTQTLTAPVRLDFAHEGTVPAAVNLFGFAHIVVGRATDVVAVPAAAVLRDDVSGVQRVATVDTSGRLRWVRVTTGLAQGGLVQIVAPPMSVGTPVVVNGQVGLADGARVRVAPP